MPERSSSQDRSILSMFAALASVGAFLLAALAIVVVSTKSTTSGTGSSAAPTLVTLSEFAIAPNNIVIATGGSLNVSNAGSQIHNLAVKEADLVTPDLNGGGSAPLDTAKLKAGAYTVACLIPGHESQGMKASLTVSDDGAGVNDAAGATSAPVGGLHTPDEYATMERLHSETLTKFATAALTTGMGVPTSRLGNQPIKAKEVTGPFEDKVNAGDASGTHDWKQFDLISRIVDWETEPGKIVKAWTYCDASKPGDDGCTVPGPWIKVKPGDWVRVNLKNELPASTDIHYHGITTPFFADGVATLTQPFIEPGQSFTYEFQAPNRPELGMYHAHAHGQEAVVNGLFAVFQIGEMDLSTAAGKSFPGRPDLAVPANLATEYAAGNIKEFPMVLNDAGVIGLSLNGKAYPATEPIVVTEGTPQLIHYYNEGLTAHPMHLHHVPQLVVAKDGFPLAQPYWADTINIAPAERYTVLLLPTGDDLALNADGSVAAAPVLQLPGQAPVAGVGVWAFHCHILTHAEGDNGLLGMVTVLAVLPKQ